MDSIEKYELIYWYYELSKEYLILGKQMFKDTISKPDFLLDNLRYENFKLYGFDNYYDYLNYTYGIIEFISSRILVTENNISSIKSLLLNSNNIKKIFINSTKLLDKLKTIYSNNNENIFEIPISIEFLQLNSSFDDNKIRLPEKLKVLKFGDKFNKLINYPNELFYLEYGDKFNSPIENLPPSLEFLIFGKSFNQSVDYLGSKLKFLCLGENFYQQLDNLPNSLEALFLSNYSSYELNNLPFGLIEFINFGENYVFKNFTIREILKISNINDIIIRKKIYLDNGLDEKKHEIDIKEKILLKNLPSNLEYMYLSNEIIHGIDKIPSKIKGIKKR